MKYLFTYLVLMQSKLFSIESIYGKISNILNPTEENCRILQHYLLEGAHLFRLVKMRWFYLSFRIKITFFINIKRGNFIIC